MTVHINGSKGKELYYNGTKIKEAYYNGNKVYSSGPLYYCYRTLFGKNYIYIYFTEKPTTPGGYTNYYTKNNMTIPATSSSDLQTASTTFNISRIIDSSSFTAGNYTYTYYPSGDLYT